MADHTPGPRPVRDGEDVACRTCYYWQRNPTVPTMWCYHPGHDFATKADGYCNNPCRWDAGP